MFPETLFHELIQAMVHPDHETRVGAHRIFTLILVPSAKDAMHLSSDSTAVGVDPPTILSRTTSIFQSAAALFERLRREVNVTGEDKELKVNSSKDQEVKNAQLADGIGREHIGSSARYTDEIRHDHRAQSLRSGLGWSSSYLKSPSNSKEVVSDWSTHAVLTPEPSFCACGPGTFLTLVLW